MVKLSKITDMNIEQLLDIWMDPKAARQMLDVYKQAKADANTAIEANNQRSDEVDLKVRELSKLKASLQPKLDEIAERERALEISQRQLAGQVLSHQQDVALFRNEEVRIKAWEHTVKMREAALENTLGVNERAMQEREALVQSRLAEAELHETKMRMRELTG
jgi:hypothetical protein